MATLKYGYSRQRDSSGKTTYTDSSGKEVDSKEALASGGRKSGGSSSKTTKSYVDEFGVIRREGGTGYVEADYQRAISSGRVGQSGQPAVINTRATTTSTRTVQENIDVSNRATEIKKQLEAAGYSTAQASSEAQRLAAQGISPNRVKTIINVEKSRIATLQKESERLLMSGIDQDTFQNREKPVFGMGMNGKDVKQVTFSPQDVQKTPYKDFFESYIKAVTPKKFEEKALSTQAPVLNRLDPVFQASGRGILKTQSFVTSKTIDLADTVGINIPTSLRKFYESKGVDANVPDVVIGKDASGKGILSLNERKQEPKTSLGKGTKFIYGSAPDTFSGFYQDTDVKTAVGVLSSPLLLKKAISLPIIEGVTAQLSTEAIGRGYRNVVFSEEQLALEKNPKFMKIYKAARREQLNAIGAKKEALTDFVPTTFGFTQKNEFLRRFKRLAYEEGFTDSEVATLAALAEQRLAFKESGELAALLGAGATTERIGSYQIKNVLTPKKITTASTKKFEADVFKVIAPLGFGEGAAESITTRIAKDEKIDPLEAFLYGGAGAVIAGTIGGKIAGYSVGRKKIRGSATEIAANIFDITEKPGDIVSDITGSIVKAPARVKARVSTAFSSTPIGLATNFLNTDIAIGGNSFVPDSGSRPGQPRVNAFTPVFVPAENTNLSLKNALDTKLNIKPSVAPAISLTSDVPTTSDVPATIDISTDLPASTDTSTTIDTTVDVDTTVGVPSTVPTTVDVPATVNVPSTVPTTVTVPVLEKGTLLLFPKVKQKGFAQAYVPEIKSKGKFFVPEKKPLTRKDALSLGGYYVDNTASAQFRLKKVQGKPQALGSSITAFNSKKFRQKKGGGGSYIEKKMYRIDTVGEKKGITAKGLAKQRAKKFLNNGIKGGLRL